MNVHGTTAGERRGDCQKDARQQNADRTLHLRLVWPIGLVQSLAIGENKKKYWEIIADNLSKAGWTWGCISGVNSNGRTIFVADAHRGDGKRFVVRADEKLTAFIELESAIHADERESLQNF